MSQQLSSSQTSSPLPGHGSSNPSGNAPNRQARCRRSYAPPAAFPPDPSIRPLLDSAKRHCHTPSIVNGALASLAELTAWQSQNQQAVVDTNGLCTLFALLKQATRSGQDAETTRLVLWVLMNLATNDSISAKLAAEPGVMADLVVLLGARDGGGNAATRDHAIFAARCLVNLTCSDTAAKEAAIKTGALRAACQALLQETDNDGAAAAYAGLLCSLAASHLSPARLAVAAAPELLQRLLQLLDSSSPTAAACAVVAARTLGHVARGGPDCQAALVRAGAAAQLLACLSGPATADPQLSAAVLDALSCLAVDQPRATAVLLSSPLLLPRLQALLRPPAPHPAAFWTKEATAAAPADGQLLLASHVLVHVLAYNSKTGTVAGSGAAGSGTTRSSRPTTPTGTGNQGAVPGALYMKLEEAARQLRIELEPAPAPASPGRAGPAARPQPPAADTDGVEAELLQLLSAVEVAELLHTVHDVLLPQLRERSVATAAGAVARLYLLAAGPGGGAAAVGRSTACLQLMAEAGLVQQLVVLQGQGDAQLCGSCLCLLDRMAGSERCRALLAGSGWLDAVEGLLESPDRVVRLLARRALCSVHAQEQGQGV